MLKNNENVLQTYTSYILIGQSFFFLNICPKMKYNSNYWNIINQLNSNSYGIFKKFNKNCDAPPCVITVTITIKEVAVNMACLASETVFLIAEVKNMNIELAEKLEELTVQKKTIT